jgi:hypothetical protein
MDVLCEDDQIDWCSGFRACAPVLLKRRANPGRQELVGRRGLGGARRGCRSRGCGRGRSPRWRRRGHWRGGRGEDRRRASVESSGIESDRSRARNPLALPETTQAGADFWRRAGTLGGTRPCAPQQLHRRRRRKGAVEAAAALDMEIAGVGDLAAGLRVEGEVEKGGREWERDPLTYCQKLQRDIDCCSPFDLHPTTAERVP